MAADNLVEWLPLVGTYAGVTHSRSKAKIQGVEGGRSPVNAGVIEFGVMYFEKFKW